MTSDTIPLPAPRSNRAVTIASRMEYAAVVVLFAFFRLVGVDAASALAGKFTRLVGPLIGPISDRARRNLAAAYPHWDRPQIEATVRGVWENLGRTTAEMAHLKTFARFPDTDRLTVDHFDRLDALRLSGKPAIFVSGHFANWEVMSIVVHRAGLDYGVVYRAANNPLIDAMIIRLRAEVMSRRQIPKGKRGGRALIETLAAGRSLAMLVDQKLNDGIEATLFGRRAMTAPAAARLSLKYGAPVIPISVVRQKGARFHVSIGEPVDFTPLGESTRDVADLTQRINDRLEADIRAHPEQWLWLHRRWPD